MTSRELLRAAAARIDCGAGTEPNDGCDMTPPCQEFATALRALADRIDDEMQFADKMRYRSIEAYGAWDCLSRLDADTSPSPRVPTDGAK